jgi:hypothetical protein
LLEPAWGGVRLTPQARILVEHIEVILERLEEAEADLCAPRWRRCAAPCGSPLQSVLFALVPSVLTRLAGRHPPLRVEIAHRDAGPAFAGLLAHERMRRKSGRDAANGTDASTHTNRRSAPAARIPKKRTKVAAQSQAFGEAGPDSVAAP